MDKSEILEAAEWLAENKALTERISDHRAKCKHWSLTGHRSQQASDPQFPDRKVADCEFCGKLIYC